MSLKGFHIPETQVDLNHNQSSSKEAPNTFPTDKMELQKPNMELTVLLPSDQIDKYFQKRKLDVTKFVYEPKVSSSQIKQREKFKSSKTIERKVTPISIRKQSEGTYVCSALRNKKSTEKTKEEHTVTTKKAKCDQKRKKSTSTKEPVDETLLVSSQMQHHTFPQGNKAIKSKQNNCSIGATDGNTNASTNIPDSSKEHNTKSVEKTTNNGAALNETEPTLISNKDQGMVIKPHVRIKNDTTIDLLPNNLNKNELIHSILSSIRFKGTKLKTEQNPKLSEKMLQTTQPSNKDIRIDAAENTWKVKGLKDQLLVFKIPVNVSNGSFHVGFRFKKPQIEG